MQTCKTCRASHTHTRTHVHNKSVIIVLIERSVSLLSIAGNDECIRSQAKQTAEFCFRMQEWISVPANFSHLRVCFQKRNIDVRLPENPNLSRAYTCVCERPCKFCKFASFYIFPVEKIFLSNWEKNFFQLGSIYTRFWPVIPLPLSYVVVNYRPKANRKRLLRGLVFEIFQQYIS